MVPSINIRHAIASSLSRPHVAWALVGALSAGSVLVFWQLLPEGARVNESTDYTSYYEPVARTLLAGQGLTFEGQPAVDYPPGYPALLAALFAIAELSGYAESLVLSVFVTVCMAASTVLLYAIASLFWRPHYALLSAGAWTTYPFALWMTKQPSVELPFVVALYSACGIFWHGLRAGKHRPTILFFAGLLLGVAALVRPIAFGLPAVFVLVLWLHSTDLPRPRRLLAAVALVAGQSAVLAPWQWWAYRHTGQWFLLSNRGFENLYDGLTFAVDLKGYREPLAVQPDVAEFMVELEGLAKNGEISTPGEVVGFVGQNLMTRPLTVVTLYAWKAGRSLYATDSGRYEGIALAAQLCYGALTLLASFIIWRRRLACRGLVAFSWLVFGYFWILSATNLPILRYMVPAMGLIFLPLPALLVSHGRSQDVKTGPKPSHG